MANWKGVETDTIRIYEEVNLFPPGTVVSNEANTKGDDALSTVSPDLSYELKSCFSTYHHAEMFDMGYSANDIAYLRLDQLSRYRKEDKANPGHTRLIFLDCRILDLTSYSIVNVGNYVRSWVEDPYEILKRWTVSVTTSKDLWTIRKKTRTSEVPQNQRKDYYNDPEWDGLLQLIPTTELTTTTLTSQAGKIGINRLLAARMK